LKHILWDDVRRRLGAKSCEKATNLRWPIIETL